jgi:hemerythrin
MAFVWNEDLATGIEKVDNQHKEIFKQLNLLLDAMDKGTHFSEEENYMVEHSYEGFHAQRAEHSQFIHDFYRLKKELLQCGTTLHLVVKTEQTLGNWLMNHIKVEDKKMALALKNKQE